LVTLREILIAGRRLVHSDRAINSGTPATVTTTLFG
jgi:hypothetical protein